MTNFLILDFFLAAFVINNVEIMIRIFIITIFLNFNTVVVLSLFAQPAYQWQYKDYCHNLLNDIDYIVPLMNKIYMG